MTNPTLVLDKEALAALDTCERLLRTAAREVRGPSRSGTPSCYELAANDIRALVAKAMKGAS